MQGCFSQGIASFLRGCFSQGIHIQILLHDDTDIRFTYIPILKVLKHILYKAGLLIMLTTLLGHLKRQKQTVL